MKRGVEVQQRKGGEKNEASVQSATSIHTD